VYAPSGEVRVRAEVEGVIDVIAVDEELWVVRPHQLVRLRSSDGHVLAEESIDLDEAGRFLQSSVAAKLPVWHAETPVLVRANPARGEALEPSGELILPLAEGRWLVWQGGRMRLWRAIGEAWRQPIGEPGWRPVDGQLLLDGRLFAVVLQRTARVAPTEAVDVQLVVGAVTDGLTTAHIRVGGARQVVIAARRGVALVVTADRVRAFDLRFGRWVRDLLLADGIEQLATDLSLTQIALAGADRLELVAPDALAMPPTLVASSVPPAGDLLDKPARVPTVAPAQEPEQPPATPTPLPDAPLARLVPVTNVVTATPAEIAQSLELRLQLVFARVAHAIAEGWDSGRISKQDPARPPFADEVAGLLRLGVGRAPSDLDAAAARLRATERVVHAAEQRRGDRLSVLDVLARDFELTPVAVAVLIAVAAPRLRGDLTRLYSILANSPDRPAIDEHLLAQLLGAAVAPEIARELDADRPLRRFGLLKLGGGERPFAAIHIDPIVVRLIANLAPDGESDQMLAVRQVDRDLEELQLPREVIVRALVYLAAPRDGEPVRIVVRGRTGSGRHTLLASLAARAGRSLAVIDLATVVRERGKLAEDLETALRRALLRGLVPCVDGLEHAGTDDPDTQVQLGAVLRAHPGPIAVRLSAEARVPLDPGYLLLDLPPRNERERGESWSIALDRHGIRIADPSDLAARYRVGPGIVERVCLEVARRPQRPTDAAAWARELDDAVRQHVENRLGTTATRVTRLATWGDIVLPEDITDSLLELTARVRHRRKVFEQWGFDRSMTTSRGITALFSGSPGTGKTMVAGVIARDLGLELFRVDVSRITSKWIGETEKNLGSLFDAAEDGQVMLLFDEADSLFGKRTEVKTSVDRYANMEVNYLLQRLDSFEGIAILTTNFGNAIDPAFKRRLTYRVTFPFPDEEMRMRLWRSLLPPEVPIDGALDLASLAAKYRLSGGYIRNATLRAAFLAAEEGSALSQEHLERAIRMEFREIGKLAETGTLE
jgi:hypothetical protein